MQHEASECDLSVIYLLLYNYHLGDFCHKKLVIQLIKVHILYIKYRVKLFLHCTCYTIVNYTLLGSLILSYIH